MPKRVSPTRIRQNPEYSLPDRWASLRAYQGQPRMHACLWGFDVHQSQSPDVAKSWNNLPKVSWAHLSNTRQAGKISHMAGCGCAISRRRLYKDAAGASARPWGWAASQLLRICPSVLSYTLWRTVDQCESAWLSKTYQLGMSLPSLAWFQSEHWSVDHKCMCLLTELLATKMPKCLCCCIYKLSKEDLDYSKFTSYFWSWHKHTYLFNLLNKELKYQCGENS